MKKQKLKYYLRGLGIGVLVTVFILSVVGNQGEMTDAQVRARALELGMVDADSIVLSELKGEGEKVEESIEAQPSEEETNVPESVMPEEISSEETSSEEISSEEAGSGETIPEETTEETVEESEIAEESSAEEEKDATEESAEKTEAPQTVTITIKSGASSYTVSKDLAEAGLVADARAYDTYLCDEGYSRGIRIGTYEIEVGAGEEEIAKIITGKR